MHHPWRTAASAHAHVALPLAEPACSLLGVCLVRRTAAPAIFMTHTIVIHHQLSNHGRGSSISPAGIHMILEFLRLCLVMVSYRLQKYKGEAICKDGTSEQSRCELILLPFRDQIGGTCWCLVSAFPMVSICWFHPGSASGGPSVETSTTDAVYFR